MSEKQKKNNPKTHLSAQHLTLGYIILVCLGYSQKSIFYTCFDIDITNYLNIEEYLLFFLPLGSGLIIMAIGFIGYIGLLLSAAKVLNVPFLPTEPNKLSKPENLLVRHFNWQGASLNKKMGFVLKNVLFISLVFIPIACFFIYNIESFNNNRLIERLLVVWAMIMIILGSIHSSSAEKRIAGLLGFGGLSLLFIVIGISSTISSTDNILKGKPMFHIVLEYKGKEIISDDRLVYIGQTKEFIFLRDLSKNSNIIFSKKDVSKVALTSISVSGN